MPNPYVLLSDRECLRYVSRTKKRPVQKLPPHCSFLRERNPSRISPKTNCQLWEKQFYITREEKNVLEIKFRVKLSAIKVK